MRSEDRYPGKYLSRRIFSWAVQYGVLKRPETCSRCGSTNGKIQGHHPDYGKPLLIEWLCTACHGKLPRIKCDIPWERFAEISSLWDELWNVNAPFQFDDPSVRFTAARQLGLPDNAPLPFVIGKRPDSQIVMLRYRL